MRAQQHHWHQRRGGGGRKSRNTHPKERRNPAFPDKKTRFLRGCAPFSVPGPPSHAQASIMSISGLGPRANRWLDPLFLDALAAVARPQPPGASGSCPWSSANLRDVRTVGAAFIHGSHNEEFLNSFSRNTQKTRYFSTRGPWRNEGLMMLTRGCAS